MRPISTAGIILLPAVSMIPSISLHPIRGIDFTDLDELRSYCEHAFIYLKNRHVLQWHLLHVKSVVGAMSSKFPAKLYLWTLCSHPNYTSRGTKAGSHPLRGG